MRITDLRQWHWIIISLIVGAGVGYVVEQSGEDLSGRHGDVLNSQRRFEESLVKLEQGRPCFTDISVHKCMVPDRKGGTKRVCVVAGSYYNGRPQQENGKVGPHWHDAFFLADIPYKPVTDLARLGKPELANKFQAIAEPTVLDYLDALGEARNVKYTYAWWQGMGLRSCVLFSFLIIGVVWPTAVNLMVYGSLRRPKEEKGIDLSKVKAHEEKPAAATVSEDDLARLGELEAELEKNLAEAAPAPAPNQNAEPKPVRKLTTAPLQPAAAAPSAEQKAFAAKQNDYYPTELRVPRQPEKKQK
ncbi:MAG: hypothetical protein JWN24_1201 [Phycisphaerales bacterium]|nr:hypothetical protein [Phycisphaerales bacterium]